MSLSKTLAFLVLVFRNAAESQARAEHAGCHMAPFSLFPPQESFPAGSDPLLGSVLAPICLRDGYFLCRTKFITEPAGNQKERKMELFISAINYATGRMAAAVPMSRGYTEVRGLLSQPWEGSVGLCGFLASVYLSLSGGC